MSVSAPGSLFTLKRVQEMLGLSKSVVSSLIAAGFVTPARGARNEHLFSFRDVMLLKTAHSLRHASIPPRKILRALAKLQTTLPQDLPLTGLRITAVGSDVVVSDRLGQYEATTGQWVMDFEVEPVGQSIAFLKPGPPLPKEDGAYWFDQGESLEEDDPIAAESAYRRAIALDPTLVYAYVNLGALLVEAKRLDEGAALYEEALRHHPDEPLLHFNQAVVHENSGRLQEAVDAYRRCLAADPDFADAHRNIARLLDESGDERGAFRHFAAYRRLMRSTGLSD